MKDRFNSNEIIENIKDELNQCGLISLLTQTSNKVGDLLDGETSEASSKIYKNYLKKINKIAKSSGKSEFDFINELVLKSEEIGVDFETYLLEIIFENEVQSRADADYKHITKLSDELLHKEVFDFLAKSSPFTKGSEGEIFKMPLVGKNDDILILKRRYDSSENEYNMHVKAKEFEKEYSKTLGNNVHVPQIFHKFNDGKNEYILMEFIPGKTLYSMILEAVISQETIKKVEEIDSEELQKDFYFEYYKNLKRDSKDNMFYDYNKYIQLELDKCIELISDSKGHLKEIDCFSDEDAELMIENLYNILKQAGVKGVADTSEILELSTNLKTKKFIYDLVNRNNFDGISIFSQEDAKYISKSLRNFFKVIHDGGLYHRDLGDNTRNLMFIKGAVSYRPCIIDFGKSCFNSMDENPYIDESLGIRYKKDENIIDNYISKLSDNGEKEPYKLNKNTSNIKMELYKIGEKYGVDTIDIKNIFRFYNNGNISKNYVFYNSLKSIFETSFNNRGFEINLSNSKDKNIQEERRRENGLVMAEIIVLLYFSKSENFLKIEEEFDYLEKHLLEKKGAKNGLKYIELYKNLYSDIKELRKKTGI